ncbi:MAG: Methyltransferase [uncultured bacterium]|nr:MAG: Methyltransferase [uncultured bacterium]
MCDTIFQRSYRKIHAMKNNLNSKPTNDYHEKASLYSHHQIEGTLKIAYKALETLLTKYKIIGEKTLDFGCGSGRSTRYLKNKVVCVEGADINQDMLALAHESDPFARYNKIENNHISARNAQFDFVFSSLVLFELSSLFEMQAVFKEIHRVMQFNGFFISIVVAEDFYQHDWVSIATDFPENKNPKSGDKVRIKIKEINLELNDYYWTREDYQKAAQMAGLSLIESVMPKADKQDGVFWLSEVDFSPYLVLVMKKTMALKAINEVASDRNMAQIPELGYLREVERSSVIISRAVLGNQYSGDRCEFSELELLMGKGNKSKFHKLISSEKFKFIEGKDLVLHVIEATTGEYQRVLLGEEEERAVKEFTVPTNSWIAEEFIAQEGYALVSARTSPGFHPDDTREATKEELIKKVGDQKEALDVIERIYAEAEVVSSAVQCVSPS